MRICRLCDTPLRKGDAVCPACAEPWREEETVRAAEPPQKRAGPAAAPPDPEAIREQPPPDGDGGEETPGERRPPLTRRAPDVQGNMPWVPRGGKLGFLFGFILGLGLTVVLVVGLFFGQHPVGPELCGVLLFPLLTGGAFAALGCVVGYVLEVIRGLSQRVPPGVEKALELDEEEEDDWPYGDDDFAGDEAEDERPDAQPPDHPNEDFRPGP
jgi:hypothetical protein